MKIEVCVCEFWSVLWQVYMCGMGKQAVHELEPEVSKDRGVCEFGSALKCNQVVHEPDQQ